MTFIRKKQDHPRIIIRKFGYIYTLTIPARGFDTEKGRYMPSAFGIPGYVIKSIKKFKSKL